MLQSTECNLFFFACLAVLSVQGFAFLWRVLFLYDVGVPPAWIFLFVCFWVSWVFSPGHARSLRFFGNGQPSVDVGLRPTMVQLIGCLFWGGGAVEGGNHAVIFTALGRHREMIRCFMPRKSCCFDSCAVCY